jgi:hypothetical protein
MAMLSSVPQSWIRSTDSGGMRVRRISSTTYLVPHEPCVSALAFDLKCSCTAWLLWEERERAEMKHSSAHAVAHRGVPGQDIWPVNYSHCQSRA